MFPSVPSVHSHAGLINCAAQFLTLVIDWRMFCVAVTAGKILEGEILRVTLSKPKNGNAQHLRVVSVVPLWSGFRPAIETLRELYGVRVG